MTSYLLDTDVIINHLRGKKPIPEEIIESNLAISIITKAELIYGAYKLKRPKTEINKINEFLDSLEIETINITDEVILNFGKLKNHLEKSDKRLSDFDLLIASTALAYNLTLLTYNLKHYSRIPKLKLFSHI